MMLVYQKFDRYQRSHCIEVDAPLPNAVFDRDEDEWPRVSPAVLEWLMANVGAHRVEWEFSDECLWFRTREQAMLFKLSWSL